jgi:hypothetical protein
MEMTKRKAWQLGRAIFALLLAVMLGGALVAHNGFRLGEFAAVSAYMLFVLACIYVSIWKQWDFEIVGWVLLGLVFVGLTMA